MCHIEIGLCAHSIYIMLNMVAGRACVITYIENKITICVFLLLL